MAQKGVLTTSDYLPIEEFHRLTQALHTEGLFLWELYCCLSFSTALRVSDILSLKWIDVLDVKELVCKEIKTGKTRRILINKNVYRKIRELYELLGSPPADQFIIINLQTGKVYTRQRINYMLKEFKYKYRLKIGSFSTHTFRKTFGRYVYENNNRSAESLIILSSIFKHGSIDTTKRYIGLTDDEINKAYKAVVLV